MRSSPVVVMSSRFKRKYVESAGIEQIRCKSIHPSREHSLTVQCDYCRGKKLRCTREKPKCSNCKNWTSGCVYSRDDNPSTGKEDNKPRSKKTKVQDEGFRNVTQASASKRVKITESQIESERENESSIEFATKPQTLATAISHVSSIFDEANMENAVPDALELSAGGFKELFNEFMGNEFDIDNIKDDVRRVRRKQEVFFIPDEHTGGLFIEHFSAAMSRAYPIIIPPPKELLQDIAFRPSMVQERGWILIFNTILCTSASSDPRLADFGPHLKWNSWLAADESSLYLEPSHLNIQALIVFACYGQDLVHPSLCCTLVTYACRMIQIVKPHIPTEEAPSGSELHTARLCLFWGVYDLDKSLSLAFGTPPILAARMYRDVELPSVKYLSEYRPHLADRDRNYGPHSTFIKHFGSFYFIQNIKLGSIQGEMAEGMLYGSIDHQRKLEIKSRLDSWVSTVTEKETIHIQQDQDYDTSIRESINLGFSFLKFEYHHLVVFLTRSDESMRDACLSSARDCLRVIGHLVSHSSSTFNGVIWQLLYYPFMPFFILFGHIITRPKEPTCYEDLKLLRQTVIYYLHFQKWHNSAHKLERIAETFTRIAEAYVRDHPDTVFQRSHSKRQKPHPIVQDQIPIPIISAPSNSFGSPHSASPLPPFHSSDWSTPELSAEDRMKAVLDSDLTLDAHSLLGLFSNPAGLHPPVHSHAASTPMRSPGMDSDSFITAASHQAASTRSPNILGSGPEEHTLMQDIQMNAQNQFSDWIFDWLAFDQAG